MNDGHFLANRWPPERSLSVPDGLLSVGQGQSLGAHTHTDNRHDSSSRLIYFYVRIWLLD